MPTLTPEASALISLMDRQYREIRGIEAEYQIMGAEGDYRPRIDYYHDAVRALTAQSDDHLGKDSRLAVERLAYDLGMLRHITAKPLTAGRGEGHLSPRAELAAESVSGSGARAPSREEKQRLAQLYKDYTVLFAAIFAEKADKNANARTEEANALIQDCHTLEDLLNQLAQGSVEKVEVVAMAKHLENDQLRKAVLHLLQGGEMRRAVLQQTAAKLKATRQTLDADIKAMDKAALSYVTGQLAVYEESKDTVKRLAQEGLNIAGKFVENAISQAQSQGRGR